jgi:hypothetical protein
MGLEVKRVPLDFDWPESEPWHGFVNPHYVKCEDCEGGQKASGWALQRFVHLLVVAGSDSLRRPKSFEPTPGSWQEVREGRAIVNFPHPWTVQAGIDDPGTDFHELVKGLAGGGSNQEVFGLGGGKNWEIMKRLLRVAGLRRDWLTCKTCNGSGIHPEHRVAYDAWERTDPSEGPGWQLWETVSEGSPCSPVFATPEELARYLADGGGHPLGKPPTYEQALAFVGKGWAPSMMGTPEHGLESGVNYVGREAVKDGTD